MTVTINTDAAHQHILKIGTYAYWIQCEQGRINDSGILKNKVNTPQEAEAMAICNALYVLHKSEFTGVKRIVVNCDCKTIFSKMNGTGKGCFGMVYKLRRNINQKYNGKIKITFNHIKAHTDKCNAESLINSWCDKEAKRQLKEAKKIS